MDHFYRNIPGYFTFPDFYSWLAKQMPKDRPSHGVEVGVASGQSAAYLAVELINNKAQCTLDLVDQFTSGPAHVAGYVAPVQHIIGKYHEGMSWDGAKRYADRSLDFVFIDASHDYQSVKNDILAWCPKVKNGGIIAGHDFSLDYLGVIQAVTETFEHWEVFRGERWGLNSKRILSADSSEPYCICPCWSVKVDHSRMRVGHINIMEHFYQSVEGWAGNEQLILLTVLRDNTNSPQQHLTIAELGVFRGKQTAMWVVELINNRWDFEYHAIDIFSENGYNPWPGTVDPGFGNNPLGMLQHNLAPILDKINLIQSESWAAASRFPDKHFDIVYIDADHEYESVKKDIEAWLPKIKPGGFICGDDYNAAWPGVLKAVNEFFGKGETWGNNYPKLTFWGQSWIYKVI